MFRPLLLALSFLTALPLGGKTEYRDPDFGRSAIYFPFIGFIIGTVAFYIAEYLLLHGVTPEATAFIIIVYLQLVTRGLHIDGLADSFDGFFGGKGSEDALRIMKDPCAGPFGITAIVIVLLGTYIALEADLASGSYIVIIPALVLSRWSMAVGAFNARYPRDDGTAKLFIGKIGFVSILLSTLLAALLASLYVGVQAVYMFFATALLVLAVRLIAKKKINGMTGDLLGAINELTVLMLLFAF
jgi:adenosylcobinamide-GDP ribazoletransferase